MCHWFGIKSTCQLSLLLCMLLGCVTWVYCIPWVYSEFTRNENDLDGFGGDWALIGAGDGFLLSRDIDLRGGPDNFLLSGLLYSNLIASLIFARLEAVLAFERCRCPRLGETDLLRVLRLKYFYLNKIFFQRNIWYFVLNLIFFLFSWYYSKNYLAGTHSGNTWKLTSMFS